MSLRDRIIASTIALATVVSCTGHTRMTYDTHIRGQELFHGPNISNSKGAFRYGVRVGVREAIREQETSGGESIPLVGYVSFGEKERAYRVEVTPYLKWRAYQIQMSEWALIEFQLGLGIPVGIDVKNLKYSMSEVDRQPTVPQIGVDASLEASVSTMFDLGPISFGMGGTLNSNKELGGLVRAGVNF